MHDEPTQHEWDFLISRRFFDDHTDRCPSDDGEASMVRFVRTQGNRVLVRGNAAQIRCLYEDAKFYAEGNVDDSAALVRSAQTVVRHLEKLGFTAIAKAIGSAA